MILSSKGKCSSVGIPRDAFSLIEVTLALGLVTFALVAIIGMIPVGLKQEQNSTEQLRGMQALNLVADDIYSIAKAYRDPTTPATSDTFLSTTPNFGITLNTPGGAAVDGKFGIDENFKKVAVNDSSSRATVYYSCSAAASVLAPFIVHIVVAWPGSAQINGSADSLTLEKNLGFVESTLMVNRL